MKVISKTRKSEISAILTTEQVVKWQAWKQVRKEQGMTKKDQFQKNNDYLTSEKYKQLIVFVLSVFFTD